jgi:hypothetical protein
LYPKELIEISKDESHIQGRKKPTAVFKSRGVEATAD